MRERWYAVVLPGTVALAAALAAVTESYKAGRVTSADVALLALCVTVGVLAWKLEEAFREIDTLKKPDGKGKENDSGSDGTDR